MFANLPDFCFPTLWIHMPTDVLFVIEAVCWSGQACPDGPFRQQLDNWDGLSTWHNLHNDKQGISNRLCEAGHSLVRRDRNMRCRSSASGHIVSLTVLATFHFATSAHYEVSNGYLCQSYQHLGFTSDLWRSVLALMSADPCSSSTLCW